MALLGTALSTFLKSMGATGATAGIRRVTVSSFLAQLKPATLKQFSANALLRELKSRGFGVRRQWLLQQFKFTKTSKAILKRQALTQSRTKLLQRDMPIDPVHRGSKYTYLVTMSVMGYTETSPAYDRDTNEWGIQPYYFGADTLMSPQEVVDAFQAKFEPSSMSKVHADWGTLKFEKAFRRGPNI